MTKRTLKPVSQRLDSTPVNFKEFSKAIGQETGFREEDIRKVWRVGIRIIIKYMVQKRAVILPMIGMFVPSIKTSRIVMSLNGGVGTPNRMQLPARWTLKFRPGAFVKKELLKQEPTEKEIDNLYKD